MELDGANPKLWPDTRYQYAPLSKYAVVALYVICIAPSVVPNAHNEHVDASALDSTPTTTQSYSLMLAVSRTLLVL